MEKLQEQRREWPVALRRRVAWNAMGMKSRTRLLEAMQQRRKFYLGWRLSLSKWIEKAAMRVGSITNFPPLELALLRSERSVSLPASVVVNLWQRYQVFEREVPIDHAVTTTALTSRLLKKASRDAAQGDNRRESGVDTPVNEHFEPVFNAAMPGLFQQPARPDAPIKMVCPYPLLFATQSPRSEPSVARRRHRPDATTLSRAETSTLNRLVEYQSASAQTSTAGTWVRGLLERAPALVLAARRTPRTEISPAQYHRRNPQNAEATQLPSSPNSDRKFFSTASPERVPNDAGAVISETTGLVDTLFDRAIQSLAAPGFNLHMLPPESSGTAVPDAPETKLTRRTAKLEGIGDAPIQLNRSDITRVADQVARVLNHRERFERERKGGFY